MKIKFDTDDDLPLNKQLKSPTMTIVVRSIFEEDGKYYRQVYLDGCYKYSYKCQNMIELILQKELILTKQTHQKNVIFVTIGTF